MPYTDEEKKDHIRELQTYLRDIAYVNTDIPPLIPDGIYGRETADAVTAFQNAYGLEPTGAVDEATWYEIHKQHQNAMNYIEEPLGIQVFPFSEYIITVGTAGTAVAMLQLMMNGIAGLYANLPPLNVTGTFDQNSKRAVEMFQIILGIIPTGEVDAATWNLITEVFNKHYPDIFSNETIMPLDK